MVVEVYGGQRAQKMNTIARGHLTGGNQVTRLVSCIARWLALALGRISCLARAVMGAGGPHHRLFTSIGVGSRGRNLFSSGRNGGGIARPRDSVIQYEMRCPVVRWTWVYK